MSEKYVVDGYCFKTQDEAAIALNEIEGIEYLRKRTNFKNPQSVLSVYDKIIDKELFKTPIGYGFLRELQQILYNASEIEPDSIRNIPVAAADEKKSKSKDKKNKKLYLMPEEQEKKYKNKITNLIILNVFIIIALIVVIIITNNSDNTNILNYRDRLEREYNEKEDELAAWDSQLREKEHQLNEREKEVNPES